MSPSPVPWPLMLIFLVFVLGLVMLVGGAELLVRGASQLAAAAGVSPLVIGLTVVAYGTSAPELAVTLQSTLAGDALEVSDPTAAGNAADIALGNVVGSNIANILLVIGISATVAPLLVARQLIRRDLPVMVGLSLLVYLFALGGAVVPWQGWLLFAGAVGFTVFTVRQGRRSHRKERQAELRAAGLDPADHALPRPTAGVLAWQFGLIVVGLALLVFGANRLVFAAVTIATWLGVSPLVIGLTIVAVGTSLPEVATSIVASLRGERDLAVGNAVGSNIFNILLVLGFTAAVTPGGVPVSPEAIRVDIPIMIAVALACLPVFALGRVITRWEGGIFLGLYVAYTAYLFLQAGDPGTLANYSRLMLFAVLPGVVLAWLLGAAWYLRRANRQSPG